MRFSALRCIRLPRTYGFHWLIFSLGWFALTAQTLLFRTYLTTFEGTELAIGSYFSSWLLWVAGGAWFAACKRIQNLSGYLELLIFLYIPAYFLQDWLLFQARELAEVRAFEAFPIRQLIGLSFLINAPTSFMTGLLFSFACRQTADDPSAGNNKSLPVARVYILETMGGILGAGAVTGLIGLGFTSVRVILIALGVLSVSFWRLQKEKQHGLIGLLPLGVTLLLFFSGVDAILTRKKDLDTWCRLLPAESYHGAFSTAQAEYQYGEYQGEFQVMSWGGICESLPHEEQSGEIAALTLAQCPTARRILMIGEEGLSLSRLLLQLPQIHKVTWMHSDPQYIARVFPLLPSSYQQELSNLDWTATELSSWIGSVTTPYDLVIMNHPDPTTLTLNRFYSVGFLESLAQILSPTGTLNLRITGGANYLGPELGYLGAVTLSTLKSLSPFLSCASARSVILKPGDDTWLIASQEAQLSIDPNVLVPRFTSVVGASRFYPPEGLASLYLIDRSRFQLKKYQEVIQEVGSENLVNQESHPRGLLYTLLLVLKAGGIPLIQVVKTLEQCGFLIILLTILSLACLRGVYLAQGAHNRAPILTSPLVSSLSTPFDNLVLIFCAGLVGISQYLVLLFLYQTAYGSLFLEMGLITGVTMAGIYGGAALVGKLLTHREHEPRLLLILCLGSHALFLVSLCSLEAILPKGLYVLLFLMAGAFTGIYFPLVAYRYQLQGAPNLLAGSRIEAVDHLGGAVGAFLTGILLLPLFGKNAVVQILILMIAVQAVPFFFRNRTAVGIILSPFDIQVRRVGYLLFGIGLVLLVSSQIVVYSRQGLYQEKFHQAALSLSASQTLELKEKNSRAGRHLVFYTYLSAKDQLTHYVLDSANLGVSTKGFAGLIHLALDVTERGDLAGFRIIESQETPAYLNLLRDWYTRLTGRNLFGPDPFQGIDAVTGATLSSTAIKHTLAAAGIDLKREILELPDEEGDRAMAQTPWRVELRLVCLLLAMCGALFLRWSPGYWRRLAYLTGILLVLGWWLNVQYSTQQVFLLLTVRGLIPDWSAPFFLIVVVPLLVLLMGNIYCGYLCPFGALQELIGELRPLRIKTEVGKGVWRYGRLSKYGLLFMVVVFFSLTRDDRILGVDPLISFFGQVREPIAWILGIGVLLASFFYRRFWCRTLCPAGAFLALLNGVALFRKYLPQSVPANCDLGVRRREEIDCLCCDRCRHEPE